MRMLSEKKWVQLDAFGDNAPLSIETTNSSIDSVRLLCDEDRSVPYVTRSDANNGLTRFVSEKNYEFGSDEGGCITVGLDTQTAFYQPYKFVTGQNVQIVTGKKLSENIAHFMVPVLRRQMTAKFNWGGNGATLGRMKRLSIMLPVRADGEPDYEYMEQYVAEKQSKMLDKYKEFAKEQIKELEFVEIPSLKEKKWEVFILDKIFSIDSGTRLETRRKKSGNRPFVGAADNNNGVTGFVANDNASKDSNVLGVNYNGNGMCIGFYHPYECIFSDDVKRFHLLDHPDSPFVLLFLKVVILQQKSKFGYLYKFNASRMSKERLLLPVDDFNKPDYEYMEQYSKNLMLRKYEQYLSYIDNHKLSQKRSKSR